MTSKIASPGSSIEAAVVKLSEGQLSKLADLTSLVAPGATVVAPPGKLPVPKTIDESDRANLALVEKKFGSVVATEVRKLSGVELGEIMEERDVLDAVEKLAKTRKDAIRTLLMNHLSESFAAGDIEVDSPEGVLLDKDGYPILKHKVSGSNGKVWSFEPRKGSVALSETKLQAISADVEDDRLTHKDWLAMTSPVRVIDENKLMLHLRSNPGLVGAIADATTRGVGSNSLRSRKG